MEENNEEIDREIGYEIPQGETDGDSRFWSGWMPPDEDGGDPKYIEGVNPNTVITRQALEMVPKKLQRNPLIATKEAQENMIRICIRQIGDEKVEYRDLRGEGLDKRLSQKQMHFVIALFDRMVSPEEAEVEDFLSTVKKGRRKA